MSFDIGTTIGDYQIAGVLGAGGMGKVYKVRNVISDRIEAMKVLLPNLDADQDLADRFIREIKVQASLDHPNIAALHTAQRVGNQLLMIMEFIEGATIESMMRQGRIPVREAVNYVSQVLSALSYAHSRGVIHRDIKPANMMLTPGGIVKLMDFGIAKMAIDRKLTQTGRTVGSLFYMSPEQIRGDANLDPRSDLYSLGISLYEMVTGRRPFEGDSDYSIMAAHLQQSPVPPVQIDPALPAALNEIVMMSIAKDPAQRFQTADAFKAALSSIDRGMPAGIGAGAAAGGTMLFGGVPDTVPQVVAAAPAAPAPAPKPPPSRRGLYMVAGSLVTIAILVAAGLEVPKWWKTRASGDTQVQNPAPATAPSAGTPVQTLNPPAQPTGAPQPQQTPAEQAQQAPPEQAPQQTQAPEPHLQPAAPLQNHPPRPVPLQPNAPAQRQAQSGLGNGQTSVPQQQQPVPPQPRQQVQQIQPAPPPTPTVDPAVTKQLEALEHRQMLMAARIAGVKTSLNHLQSQQARAGLSISPELVSMQRRMEYYMDKAEAAMRDGKAAVAKDSLDSAESELEKLEQRFGR